MPHRHSLLRTLLPARIAACVLLASCCAAAWGQATSTAPTAPRELSDSDRAKRDADKVFQWIRIHSDKPRKAAAVPAPAAAPVAAVAAKPARATARSESGITETVAPLAAANPAAAPSVAVERAAAPALQAESVTALAERTLDTRVASLAPASMPAVDEDMALVPVQRVEPEFSAALMRTLRSGQVQVSFTVKPDGTVVQAHAVSSSHPRLKEVAVATVSQWRFQPLHHAQQAVVELGFNLD